MISFENIPDLLGYLVLNDDNTIYSSGGDLENAEYLSNIIPVIVSLTDKLKQEDEPFHKISVIYKDYSYIICLSNRKIYIVKRVFNASKEVTPDTAHLIIPQNTNILNVSNA
ncbi:hypothetical protein O3M35_010939 [Rhynocoris fuscipes]|uniref:Late endosomal/lysosomal adaptor and MAPK and MTOR activator 4 n=1 Tax=Rhynocoris fuscipes TaxID=488301 RepID=A0AAW1D7X1_9HEMI